MAILVREAPVPLDERLVVPRELLKNADIGGDPMIDRRQKMALQLRRRNEWLNMLLGASKVWVGLYA